MISKGGKLVTGTQSLCGKCISKGGKSVKVTLIYFGDLFALDMALFFIPTSMFGGGNLALFSLFSCFLVGLIKV
jgi:hypothetical protein